MLPFANTIFTSCHKHSTLTALTTAKRHEILTTKQTSATQGTGSSRQDTEDHHTNENNGQDMDGEVQQSDYAYFTSSRRVSQGLSPHSPHSQLRSSLVTGDLLPVVNVNTSSSLSPSLPICQHATESKGSSFS